MFTKEKTMPTQKLHQHIDKDNINDMVITFYTKILEQNGTVAQVFINQLGEDINNPTWQEHLEILTNFWAKMTLDDPSYDGNPLRAHIHLPLDKDMFSSWLVLFFESVDSKYEPHLAQIFKLRAQDIAMNFMRKLEI